MASSPPNGRTKGGTTGDDDDDDYDAALSISIVPSGWRARGPVRGGSGSRGQMSQPRVGEGCKILRCGL